MLRGNNKNGEGFDDYSVDNNSCGQRKQVNNESKSALERAENGRTKFDPKVPTLDSYPRCRTS
jgi:hypothetical protein